MPTFPRRGEVFFVRFPDELKERPAVIISINARNERANSVLAIPLTTDLRPAPSHVLLVRGDGGLTHESMARCENITLLRKERLQRGPLGSALTIDRLREIEQALQRAIGIPA